MSNDVSVSLWESMCRSTLNHTDSVWGGCHESRTLEQNEDVIAASKENNDYDKTHRSPCIIILLSCFHLFCFKLPANVILRKWIVLYYICFVVAF